MAQRDPGDWRRAIGEEFLSPEGVEAFTTSCIESARGRPVGDLGEEYANSLEWMRTLAANGVQVRPELLSGFVGELARLASNLGQPPHLKEDVQAVLQEAIAAQRAAGGPMSALFVALASYLGTREAESRERGRAIDDAVAHAEPGSDDWGNAMVARCAYEVTSSQYSKAIRTARELREAVGQGLNPVFECGALTHEGTALYTSFHDLAEAERLLSRATTFAPRAETDQRIARWIATAFHYRGRVAEALGRDKEALELYLRGKEYQDRCPEEIEANAFLQLRLAEPLCNANLFDAAHDHLRKALHLAEAGANTGSAQVQVKLGLATLKAKQRDLAGAEEDGRAVLSRCRKIRFRRGELLSLGFLFTVRVKRHRYPHALVTLLWIVPTLFTGELRRNNLFKLRSNIPLLFRMAFRRIASGSRPPAAEPLTACPCPLHEPPGGAQVASSG